MNDSLKLPRPLSRFYLNNSPFYNWNLYSVWTNICQQSVFFFFHPCFLSDLIDFFLWNLFADFNCLIKMLTFSKKQFLLGQGLKNKFFLPKMCYIFSKYCSTLYFWLHLCHKCLPCLMLKKIPCFFFLFMVFVWSLQLIRLISVPFLRK